MVGFFGGGGVFVFVFFFWLGMIMLRLKSIKELKAELSHYPILAVYILLDLLLPYKHLFIVCTLSASSHSNQTVEALSQVLRLPSCLSPASSSENPCDTSDVSAAGGCRFHEVLSEFGHMLPALIHWENLPGMCCVTNATVCRARA